MRLWSARNDYHELFVSHREACVTIVERSAQGWSTREVRSGEVASLAEPPVRLAVDELYAGIALDR